MEKKFYPFDPSNPIIRVIIGIDEKRTMENLEAVGPVKPLGYFIDGDEFISISRSPEVRSLVFKTLSKAARDLFFLIPMCLNKDYQYVLMPKSKRDEMVGEPCNERTYRNGINQLIQYNIIDHKDRATGAYWINHRFFYYGVRRKMFPDNTYIVNTIRAKLKEV